MDEQDDGKVADMRTQSYLIALLVIACSARAGGGEPAHAGAASPGHAATVASTKRSPYAVGALPDSARRAYTLDWGVDQMATKLTESGALVRFTYRVTDAAKAAPLNDRAATPYLYDEKTRAVLEVPLMEKVGPLRQAMPPEVGKQYWMVFSNKGGYVQPGHRVSVIIGSFRVDGLIVE
jgi:hypothetical protein